MMGSTYVDVDDAYIDRLKDDIRIACHRLEEHGHESLVVTVKGNNHDLIGSEIGIHFLRDRSVFVNDFVLYSVASKHRVKQEATVVEVPVKKPIPVHSTKTFDVPNIPDSLNTPLPVVENGDDGENKLFDDDTDDYDDGGDDFSGILDTLGGGPENQDKMDTELVGNSESEAKVSKRKVKKKGEVKSSNYDLKRMPDVKVVLTKLEDDMVRKEKSTGETVARAVSKIVDRSEKAKKARKIDGKSEEKAAADDNAEKINNSIENDNAEVIDKDENLIQVVQIPVKSKVQIKEIKAEQTPSGQYRCSHCYQFLSSKDHISQHIQDHTAFACTWCGKLCRSYESLEKHKKFRGCSRHLIDFECKPCGEKFGSELDLKAHVEKVHDNILKVMKGTFKCEKCNTIFDYQGHLNEHSQKIPDCDKVVDKDNSEDNDKKTDCQQEVSYKNPDTGEMKVTTVGKLLDKVKNMSRKCKVTCELCGKYYESKSSYQRHIRIHYELKMIPCNICGANFTNMDNYKKHIKIHKEKPFCCLTCYNRFSCKILLDNHMNLNCKPFPTKEELVCKDCGYQSSNRSSYKQHRRLLHTEMLETCDICKKSFKRRTHLQQHLRTVHGEVPQIARESKSTDIECKICNKKFLSNKILNSHMKTHGPPNISCDKCDYKTTTRKNLVGHMRTHFDKSRIQPYVCEICGKAYGTKYYLITHSRIHTGERPYICDFPECGKGFRSADTLQTHKKRHSDTCGYMCDFCGRGFKTRSEFSHHRRYHIIEYRWPCEYCEEKFKMLKYYKNHILKKHPEKTEEVEKKRNCLFFRCTMCPKVFAKRNYWQEHENFHKGHKPWVCQYCDKSFCSKSNLRQHVRSHLGVNNKKCALCSRSYSDLEMLKRHLKEKHSLSEPVAAIRVEEVKLKAQTSSTVRPVRTKALSVRPKGQGQEVVEKMEEKNSLEDSREDSREDGVPFDQMMAIQMRNEDLESSLRLQQFHQQYVILDQGNRIPNLPPWQE